MHERTWGYVAPVPMALTDGGAAHPSHHPDSDDVAAILSRMGLDVLSRVGGDLPLGQGFASSTALALLHLGDQVPDSIRADIVKMIDWMHHGFMPSGLDYASVASQSPGLYLAGDWEPAPELELNIAFVEVPPGPRRPGSLTRAAVDGHSDRLAPLADLMTGTIRNHRHVSVDVLTDYAESLFDADVYNTEQRTLIEAALAGGIVAKGIGGLYNKAVLLSGEPDRIDALLEGRDLVRLGGATRHVRPEAESR